MKTVELRHAYAWSCEECGRDNYHNGIVVELSAEEVQTLREEQGIESYVTGDWHCIPDEVTCQHCGATFRTQHYHQTDEDDEEGQDA